MTCPHGYEKPAMCFSCMEDGPVAPPSMWHPSDSTFRAAYAGTCPTCDNEFDVGETIRQWNYGPSYGSPEQTAYTHADCGAPAR